jgi:hypothetical protein
MVVGFKFYSSGYTSYLGCLHLVILFVILRCEDQDSICITMTYIIRGEEVGWTFWHTAILPKDNTFGGIHWNSIDSVRSKFFNPVDFCRICLISLINQQNLEPKFKFSQVRILPLHRMFEHWSYLRHDCCRRLRHYATPLVGIWQDKKNKQGQVTDHCTWIITRMPSKGKTNS